MSLWVTVTTVPLQDLSCVRNAKANRTQDFAPVKIPGFLPYVASALML